MEYRQGKGPTLKKLVRNGNFVTITSRQLGYPITLEITPDLIDFLKLEETPAQAFDPKNPIDVVRFFAREIQNGRVLADIAEHAGRELIELKDEIALVAAGQPEGGDGVVGEAIDIIACALDAIFVHRPETTDEEVCAILLKKCEKWARRYKDSVEGDRSIE